MSSNDLVYMRIITRVTFFLTVGKRRGQRVRVDGRLILINVVSKNIRDKTIVYK